METREEVQQVISKLSASVWTFSALSYAAETGMLKSLNEPRSISYVSENTGVPGALVERILDVLVALNLVKREGNMFVAENGLLPMVNPSAMAYFLANLRANYLESRHLIDSAKQPSTTLGWNYTEPEILQSQGLVSTIGGESLREGLYPELGDLSTRLEAPSARFLDIGTGIGAISIMACRFYPNLHVVGLDPLEAALIEAQKNIAAAGLTDRIELRRQSVEDISDEDAFDLAFFPQMFMPDDVVKQGLSNIRRALRPGGWVLVVTMCVPGMELQAEISRLRDTLWGGSARVSPQIEALLADANFDSVSTHTFPGGGNINVIAGRHPI